MRVVLTGGGTGGHIYPALAIGQALQKEWPTAELLYIGSKSGLESKLVPAAGVPFRAIEVEGWQRKLSYQAVWAGWKAVRALYYAGRLLREFSPDLVVATGGYVCLPVAWAASRQKIPTVIHEQNALPGLTNRFLSTRVERVLLTFAASARHFPDKAQNKLRVTGLPIRPCILEVTREEGLKKLGLSPDKLTILSVGGSRGAKSLNKAMLTVCRTLARDNRVQVIHITGPDGFEAFRQGLAAEGIEVGNCGNIILRPYLHEMEDALACADLCVARAGAAFLAEMTAKGIPGVLIPYPHAAENHQQFNAQSLVDQGAAVMILDAELTGEKLGAILREIMAQEGRRQEMARHSQEAGKPEAITKILDVVKQLV